MAATAKSEVVKDADEAADLRRELALLRTKYSTLLEGTSTLIRVLATTWQKEACAQKEIYAEVKQVVSTLREQLAAAREPSAPGGKDIPKVVYSPKEWVDALMKLPVAFGCYVHDQGVRRIKLQWGPLPEVLRVGRPRDADFTWRTFLIGHERGKEGKTIRLPEAQTNHTGGHATFHPSGDSYRSVEFEVPAKGLEDPKMCWTHVAVCALEGACMTLMHEYHVPLAADALHVKDLPWPAGATECGVGDFI